MSTFEENLEHVQHMVESIGEGFDKPDDDWMTVAILMGEQPIIAMLAVDKDEWPKVVQALGKQYRPEFVALVLSSWTAASTTVEEHEAAIRKYGSVSKMPNRREVLMLQVSDGHRNEMWFADINRFEDIPPKLGPWETHGELRQIEGPLAALALAAFPDRGHA